MFELVKVVPMPSRNRLGALHIRYHDMLIMCDLCLYKFEKLYIRLPERWFQDGTKVNFLYMLGEKVNQELQETIIEKIKLTTGLTLERAIEIKKSLFSKKKRVAKK